MVLKKLKHLKLKKKMYNKRYCRCTIKSPVLARKRGSVLSKEADRKVVRSVLTFDFSLYTPDQFIAGVEGGLIVHCSTLSTNTLKGKHFDILIMSSVLKFFRFHEGGINCRSSY